MISVHWLRLWFKLKLYIKLRLIFIQAHSLCAWIGNFAMHPTPITVLKSSQYYIQSDCVFLYLYICSLLISYHTYWTTTIISTIHHLHLKSSPSSFLRSPSPNKGYQKPYKQKSTPSTNLHPRMPQLAAKYQHLTSLQVYRTIQSQDVRRLFLFTIIWPIIIVITSGGCAIVVIICIMCRPILGQGRSRCQNVCCLKRTMVRIVIIMIILAAAAAVVTFFL